MVHRQLLTGCFLALLLLQSFSAAVVYAGFKANQDYIAQELCENRDMPEMDCHGKCYLEKQLHKEQQEKEQAPAAYEGPAFATYLAPEALSYWAPMAHKTAPNRGGAYCEMFIPSPTLGLLRPPA